MFANWKLASAFVCAICSTDPASTFAQEISLTEAAEPDSKAWEEPARISFTINNDGPDTFSGQVNLDFSYLVDPKADRFKHAGGNIVWNRESGGTDKQNNFEAGLFFKSEYSTAYRDRPTDGSAAKEPGLDVATRFGLAYARTATYADKTIPVCVATPALRQCSTQFSESVRGGATFSFFSPEMEGWDSESLAYSISPKISVDGDWLLDNLIDASTGLIQRGGFLSAKAGLSIALSPKFIAPAWDLRASYEVRKRLAVSNDRLASTEKTSTFLEAGLTYYVVNPPAESDDGWRAGIGIKYSRGSDPFVGRAKVDQFVLSIRIGQY